MKHDYVVEVREVHVQLVNVKARSSAEAIKLVEDGDGNCVDGALEYLHTLESDLWTAHLVQ